jgi:hypothetical protein
MRALILTFKLEQSGYTEFLWGLQGVCPMNRGMAIRA